MQVLETPSCPRCNSSEVQKRGFSRQGKKRFSCKNCGCMFIFPRPAKDILKPKEKHGNGFMFSVKRPLCPRCGSNANIRLCGFARDNVRRKFRCEKCHRCFNFPPKPKSEHSSEFYEKRQIVKFTPEQKAELHAKALVCDSLVNVPCFCCETRLCDPTKCEALTLWQNGKETIEKVCIMCDSPFNVRLNHLEDDFCSIECADDYRLDRERKKKVYYTKQTPREEIKELGLEGTD